MFCNCVRNHLMVVFFFFDAPFEVWYCCLHPLWWHSVVRYLIGRSPPFVSWHPLFRWEVFPLSPTHTLGRVASRSAAPCYFLTCSLIFPFRHRLKCQLRKFVALSVVVVQVLIMVGWAFCGARSDALGRHRPVLGLGFNRFNGSSAGSLPARVLGSCCW